jgi:hypothetical protein
MNDVALLAEARSMCSDGTARDLVEWSGLTQLALSLLANTNQATVSRWLSGTRLPRSTPAGLRFARLLGQLARRRAVNSGAPANTSPISAAGSASRSSPTAAGKAPSSALTVLALTLAPLTFLTVLRMNWSLAPPPGILAELSGKLTLPVPLAGRLCGLGRDRAYQAVERGELPVLRSGRRIAVPTVPLLRQLGLDGAEIAAVVGLPQPSSDGAAATAAPYATTEPVEGARPNGDTTHLGAV